MLLVLYVTFVARWGLSGSVKPRKLVDRQGLLPSGGLLCCLSLGTLSFLPVAGGVSRSLSYRGERVLSSEYWPFRRRGCSARRF